MCIIPSIIQFYTDVPLASLEIFMKYFYNINQDGRKVQGRTSDHSHK